MKKIVSIFLLFLINFVYCKADEFSDIDKKEIECINKTSSTYKMLICTQNAINAWDNQINNYYNLLLKNKTVDKKLIEQSQKEWLNYKVNDYNMVNIIVKKQGTMYKNVISGFKREIVKNRAIELRSYYQTIIE